VREEDINIKQYRTAARDTADELAAGVVLLVVSCEATRISRLGQQAQRVWL
jgi:hypothetical protein